MDNQNQNPAHEPVSEEELADLMAQFDKESNTRRFTGVPQKIMRTLLILFSLYSFYIIIFGRLPLQVHRASFVALVVFLAYLLYPASSRSDKTKIAWYDFLLAILSSSCYFYIVFNFAGIVKRAGNYSTLDIAVAILAVLFLLEICRRVVGLPIVIIVSLFILYAYFGKFIPGFFGHRGYTVKSIASHLFYTTEGVMGTPIGVCSTFIFLFILFGAFLEKTGVGKFFIDIADSIAGKAAGGPAKVAVIASALEGTISGSSVANTVGSGSFTIPMMKKTGYKPEFAAAVEAAASTGGQIMPPIMGAAAFLMADITGINYSTIITAAILPAILYFSGIFMMVHFEAKKLGLKGMPPEQIPKFGKLFMTQGYLLIPLAAIIYFLMAGRTPATAAYYAIIIAIIASMFRKETRMTIPKFLEALENGARNILGVAIACATAGIIVGIVTLTGLGMKLATGLLSLSGGVTIVGLFLTMIASLILGMGVPTTANYVIMATITAPIVMQLGVPLLAAHLFVFYFGIVADITPPVALAAYAGSAIAKSNPFKTGVTATRLAITAFIIPYIFALNPALLLVDSNFFEVVAILFTSFMGMIGISAGMEGYWSTRLKVWERLPLIAAGLCLIIPEIYTDLVGIAVISVIFVIQLQRKKKEALTL